MSSSLIRGYYVAATTTDILEGFANTIAQLPREYRVGGLLWIRDTRSPGARYIIPEDHKPRRVDSDWIVGRISKIHRPEARSTSIWGIPYSQFEGAIWVSYDGSVLVALRLGPDQYMLCCHPWATRAVLKLVPKEQWEKRMLPSGYITYFQKIGVNWERTPEAPGWTEPVWFDNEYLKNC